MKSVMRTAALGIPAIRRLYDHMLEQNRRQSELQQQLADARAALAASQQAHAEAQRAHAEAQQAHAERDRQQALDASHYAARESQLVHELAAAAEERDVLELQLYVMRSDLQRAAVRNQELSVALHAAEAKAERALHHPSALGSLASDPGEALSEQIARLSDEISRLSAVAALYESATPELAS